MLNRARYDRSEGSPAVTDPILYKTLPSGIARMVLDRADTRNARHTAFSWR